MNPNQIIVFDTTLRDGQQCPGAGMSFENNIKFAHMAAELGIDVLEAGFPSASKADFEIVNTVAKELAPKNNSMVICGLCQLRENQVDITIESLLPAVKYKKARLHTYFPVDPNLIIASLGDKANDKNQIIKNLFDFTSKAVKAGFEVEFSPEGYSRIGENFDFATELIRAAISAGATTINCPDTIGGANILQGKNYYVENIKKHAEIIKKEFPDKNIIWSCHNHNDFGCAVENTMHAIFDGPVRQIEVAINGLGERAGNASLEQCIMIIKEFAKFKDSKNSLFTNIKTEKLKEISDFAAKNMLPRQPNYPIVGDNSARHTSGGHTNAILSNPLSYQPFDPAEVGNKITFVFGPLSGGNHAQDVIRSFGYVCEDNEKAQIAQFIKDFYAHRRKGVTDEELLLGYFEYRNPIKINSFDYSKSENSATINLEGKLFNLEGKLNKIHSGKDSPLAALKILIEENFGKFNIQHYDSKADSEGIDAKSIATIIIKVEQNGETYEGIGIDEDIEISAMKALISAVNKAHLEEKYRM